MHLSSYAEASGSTQTVAQGGNVVFDIGPDDIDIVGTGIGVDASGTVFTINRAGLYHVEWSMNLQAGSDSIIICLLENGVTSSAISSEVLSGNKSSGALINVTDGDLPFTISLHNFGGEITIADADMYAGTAVSMRILRFADGPTM